MKVSYSKYSSWNGDDLTAIEAQIKSAQADYQKYLDEYNYGIQNLSAKYAKNVRWPRVVKAKDVLDALQGQYESMLSIMGKTQAVDLVDTTVAEATTPTENKTPWTTIGLAVGALIIIVIIVKLV